MACLCVIDFAANTALKLMGGVLERLIIVVRIHRERERERDSSASYDIDAMNDKSAI